MRVRPLVVRLVALALGLAAGLVLAAALGEAWFRYARRHDVQDCRWRADPEVGFLNRPGSCRIRTSEFDVRYDVDGDGWNDDPVAEGRPVILALGDSHTWAVGVAKDQAWPNVLERLLAGGGGAAPSVFNLAVPGYNLGQEYQILRRHQARFRPRAVVLAFSMATDAYDIRPPRYGGFLYGAEYPRSYFDLDEDGALVLLRGGGGGSRSRLEALKARLLDHSKLYDAVRRSALAYYAVSLLRLTGQSAWPTMDGALGRQLGPADEHSWRLVEKVLERLREELETQGVAFTVVVLPYLPQVYDEVWEKAFALGGDGFDRFAGNARLSRICRALRIDCLDLTPDFVARARATGRYLHFPMDGHPNVEGQALIGRRVFEHLRGRLDDGPSVGGVRERGDGEGRRRALPPRG